jgi:threonine/homoserine efflux transporter RhtA
MTTVYSKCTRALTFENVIAYQYSRDADPQVRQAAAYGVGICAQVFLFYSKRTHSIITEHILAAAYGVGICAQVFLFYSKRTHSIVREHILAAAYGVGICAQGFLFFLFSRRIFLGAV